MNSDKSIHLKYGIEDRPSKAATFLYGLQWWIVTFVSIIVIGVIVARLGSGSDTQTQMLYMQKLFVITAVTLGAQILFGHRLPVVAGPASVLLIGILISAGSGTAAVYTAIAVGGLLLSIAAASGMLSVMQKVFTDRVILVIILLIPVTLMPVIIDMIFSSGSPLFAFIFSLASLFALVTANRFLRGVWKSTTLIWAIIACTAVIRIVFPVQGDFSAGHSAGSGNLFIRPDFNPGVILAFIFCFIALAVNELSSIEAVGRMLEAPDMKRRTKRGVIISGISNIAAGFFGVIGSVDYTTSPGVIASTGCASRYPFIITAVLLVLTALCPPLMRLLISVPALVTGIILLYLMAAQMSSGLQMLSIRSSAAEFDQAMIIALPLLVAMTVSLMPAGTQEQIPGIIRPIVCNGFVMGVISVLLMEHLIMRKKQS